MVSTKKSIDAAINYLNYHSNTGEIKKECIIIDKDYEDGYPSSVNERIASIQKKRNKRNCDSARNWLRFYR